MKNKRKVEDILHSVSDDEIEKITSEYPDADKKKMNAIYNEIERRVQTGNDDFSGDSVSGVERYNRNIVVRRAATIAACLAFVAAGTGTIYALSRSSKTVNDSYYAATETISTDTSNTEALNSQLKEEMTKVQKNIEDTSKGINDAYDKSDIPDDITKEWLLKRCQNSENNFKKCYMETMEKSGLGLCVRARDNEKGIMYEHYSESYITDYAYNGKRISLWSPPDKQPDIVENPVENLTTFAYSDFLNDLNLWSIEGREEYLGRQCAVILYSSKLTGADGESRNKTEYYIDLKTGIILRAAVIEGDIKEYTMETFKFYVDDDATMIPTPQDIKKMIADGGYVPEEGLSLDFLDEEPSQDATKAASKASEADLSKDEIYDLCMNAQKHYDNLAASYLYECHNSIRHPDADNPKVSYYHITADMTIDNKAGTLWAKRTMETSYDNDPTLNKSVEEYFKYKGTTVSATIDTENDWRDKYYHITHDATVDTDSAYGYCPVDTFFTPDHLTKALLEDRSNWLIVKKDIIADRYCVQLNGSNDSYGNFNIWVDTETGVWLRYTLDSPNTADTDRSYATFEINSIEFNTDQSKIYTAAQFKKDIEGYTCPDAYGNTSLDFLDE